MNTPPLTTRALTGSNVSSGTAEPGRRDGWGRVQPTHRSDGLPSAKEVRTAPTIATVPSARATTWKAEVNAVAAAVRSTGATSPCTACPATVAAERPGRRAAVQVVSTAAAPAIAIDSPARRIVLK